MEICSECLDFNTGYPSDITVWINGIEIGTWTSLGERGDRYGRLNPSYYKPKEVARKAEHQITLSSETKGNIIYGEHRRET